MKESIVIFGASTSGKICYKILKDRFHVKYFCDNNKSIWGQYVNGIEVISPYYLREVEKQYDRIIITSYYYEEIREQLLMLEIDKPIEIMEVMFVQETIPGLNVENKELSIYINGEKIYLDLNWNEHELDKDLKYRVSDIEKTHDANYAYRRIGKFFSKKKSKQISDYFIYDDMYKLGGYNKEYFKHYSDSQYIEMWLKALAIIKKGNSFNIIDIGCGPGQFAEMLFDNKVKNYTGIDFSEEAIKLAKERNGGYKNQFGVEDAFKSDIFDSDYGIAIFFEILEHIEEDIQLLNRVRTNSKILLSVPNFPDKTHVRFFVSEEHIRNRYCKYVNIHEIFTFNIGERSKIYLVEGTKK